VTFLIFKCFKLPNAFSRSYSHLNNVAFRSDFKFADEEHSLVFSGFGFAEQMPGKFCGESDKVRQTFVLIGGKEAACTIARLRFFG